MSLEKEVKIWKCDNCGKTSRWTRKWRSKTIYHKKWDEIITVCSDECGIEFDMKPRKNKGQHHE